jgi:hypothetical protein
MGFEPKLNSAGLFTNDRTPDKSDFSGSIEIQCPKCQATSAFWLNGWRKTSKNGLAYISLALKPKSDNAANREERQ